MERLERLSARLDNIRAVEPILSALRTIALGSRLLAMNRVHTVNQYRQELLRILALVAPHLSRDQRIQGEQAKPDGRLVLLVIGSERGLCGAFNDAVAAYAEQVLLKYTAAGTEVTLIALGKQAERALRRHGRLPVWSGRLPVTALPPYELACRLTAEWLQVYEEHELAAVEVIYNVSRGVTGYEPGIARLLPPVLPVMVAGEPEWPPIIETDPLGLYTHTVDFWLSATFYGIMLNSAVAEHWARYQLLEGAAQNAKRLIEELRLFLQVARQEAITAEIQDLASGAGLIGAAAD